MGTSESFEDDRKEDLEKLEKKDVKPTENLSVKTPSKIVKAIEDHSFIKLEGHGGTVTRTLYFPEHDMILSVSIDGIVRYWKYSTGKKMKELKIGQYDGYTRYMVKLNDHEFLVCCGRQILKYSILDKLNRKIAVYTGSYFIHVVLRLTDRLFAHDELVHGRRNPPFGNITILDMSVDYNTSKVRKLFSNLHLDRRTKLRISNIFEDSLYFSCMYGCYEIKLLDYQRNVVKTVFAGHNRDPLYSFCVTKSSEKNEEFVIGGGQLIYIYKVSSSSKNDIYTSCYRIIDPKFLDKKWDCIYSIVPYQVQEKDFLLCGNSCGEISLFVDYLSTDNSEGRLLIDKHKLHLETIFFCSFLTCDEENPGNSAFVTCSLDKTAKIHYIKDYCVKNKHNHIEIICNNNQDHKNVIEDPRRFNFFQLHMDSSRNVMRKCVYRGVNGEMVVKTNESLPPISIEKFKYSLKNWIYFEKHKIIVILSGIYGELRATLFAFQYHQPGSRSEIPGDPNFPINSDLLEEIARSNNLLISSILKWDDDTFLGTEDNGKISSYSARDLLILKDGVHQIPDLQDLQQKNRKLFDCRKSNLIKKLNNDLFICLTYMQIKNEILNIYSYEEDGKLFKKIRFSRFELKGSGYGYCSKVQLCSSKRYSDSCFYKQIRSNIASKRQHNYIGLNFETKAIIGVEMVDYENDRQVSEYILPTVEMYEIERRIKLLEIYQSQIKEETVICMYNSQLYFLDPQYFEYENMMKKKKEKLLVASTQHEEEEEEGEVIKMKIIRIVDLCNGQKLYNHYDVTSSSVLKNQILFATNSANNFFLNVHEHPFPIIYHYSETDRYNNNLSFVPLKIRLGDDGGEEEEEGEGEGDENINRHSHLMLGISNDERRVIPKMIDVFDFNYNFNRKHILDGMFDFTDRIVLKDVEARVGFLVIECSGVENFDNVNPLQGMLRIDMSLDVTRVMFKSFSKSGKTINDSLTWCPKNSS